MFAFPEGGAVGQRVEDRRVKVAELQAVFRKTGFPFHILPLEQVSVGAAAPRPASQPLVSGSSQHQVCPGTAVLLLDNFVAYPE